MNIQSFLEIFETTTITASSGLISNMMRLHHAWVIFMTSDNINCLYPLTLLCTSTTTITRSRLSEQMIRTISLLVVEVCHFWPPQTHKVVQNQPNLRNCCYDVSFVVFDVFLWHKLFLSPTPTTTLLVHSKQMVRPISFLVVEVY